MEELSIKPIENGDSLKELKTSSELSKTLDIPTKEYLKRLVSKIFGALGESIGLIEYKRPRAPNGIIRKPFLPKTEKSKINRRKFIQGSIGAGILSHILFQANTTEDKITELFKEEDKNDNILEKNLGYLSLIGQAAIATDKELVYKICETIEDTIENTIINTLNEKGLSSYVDSVKGQLKVLLILYAIILIIQKTTNLKVGNSAGNEIEKVIEDPIIRLIVCIIGPILEELIFRGVIQGYLKNFTGDEKYTNYIVNTMFAFTHNIREGGFDTKYIPIPLFVGGMYLSYLKEKRGITHSMLAHMLGNTFLMGITLSFDKLGIEI